MRPRARRVKEDHGPEPGQSRLRVRLCSFPLKGEVGWGVPPLGAPASRRPRAKRGKEGAGGTPAHPGSSKVPVRAAQPPGHPPPDLLSPAYPGPFRLIPVDTGRNGPRVGSRRAATPAVNVGPGSRPAADRRRHASLHRTYSHPVNPPPVRGQGGRTRESESQGEESGRGTERRRADAEPPQNFQVRPPWAAAREITKSPQSRPPPAIIGLYGTRMAPGARCVRPSGLRAGPAWTAGAPPAGGPYLPIPRLGPIV